MDALGAARVARSDRRGNGDMSDEERKEQYELFVLGTAEPEAAEEIRALLARGDAETIRGVAEARALVAALALTATEVEPPKRLKRRLMAAVRRDEPGIPSWTWAWATATALALLVSLNFWQREQNKAQELAQIREQLMESETRLAALNPILEFLNEPQLKITSFGAAQPQPPRGRILVSPQRGVLLVAQNLTPPPEGRTYQMWVVPKSGAPVSAGIFQPDAGGRAIHLNPQAIDLAKTAAIAVSNEPAGGSAAPTTTPFIVSPVGE
jgi:hypothetical protein